MATAGRLRCAGDGYRTQYWENIGTRLFIVEDYGPHRCVRLAYRQFAVTLTLLSAWLILAAAPTNWWRWYYPYLHCLWLALSLPVAWTCFTPAMGFRWNHAGIVATCCVIGFNSFLWGYGRLPYCTGVAVCRPGEGVHDA